MHVHMCVHWWFKWQQVWDLYFLINSDLEYNLNLNMSFLIHKCIEMDWNKLKWIEMNRSGLNGLKWTEVNLSGSNGPHWTELKQMDWSGLKWTGMDRSGSEWTEWIKVDWNGSNLVKWTEVNRNLPKCYVDVA